jgi:hypothetical protein
MTEINRALKNREREIQALLKKEGVPQVMEKPESSNKQGKKH